jgi:hypothetical protein
MLATTSSLFFDAFNPDNYGVGDYDLRLAVYNDANTLMANCDIAIQIEHPTATPSATPQN